jgi:hypothetical protein
MTSYGTDYAGACLDFLHEQMGGWEIIDPAVVFADTADWLARWPSLHRDLSVVIVFGDEAAYVGAGCLREVTDAIVAGIPVSAWI